MTPYGVTEAVELARDRPHTPAHTMAPAVQDLPDVLPTDRLNGRGMATPVWRDELRRIPNVRNGFTVVGALAQSFGVVIAAAWINTWWSYLIAFVLMTRGHVCLNILAHEAAHRLLFTNRRLNDNVGRWLLAYPTYQAMLVYRRVHFAHHRDEMGPDEPDLALYAGLPDPEGLVAPQAEARRDRQQRVEELQVARPGHPVGARREALQILAVQAVMLGASLAFMRPLGVRRVDPVVVDVVEGVQPPAVDRRARRHDPLEGPTAHDPRDPAEPARPLLDGAVQHRLAPRAPRRHGGSVAQPPAVARRAGPLRMGDRGHHVPELPRVLASRHALIAPWRRILPVSGYRERDRSPPAERGASRALVEEVECRGFSGWFPAGRRRFPEPIGGRDRSPPTVAAGLACRTDPRLERLVRVPPADRLGDRHGDRVRRRVLARADTPTADRGTPAARRRRPRAHRRSRRSGSRVGPAGRDRRRSPTTTPAIAVVHVAGAVVSAGRLSNRGGSPRRSSDHARRRTDAGCRHRRGQSRRGRRGRQPHLRAARRRIGPTRGGARRLERAGSSAAGTGRVGPRDRRRQRRHDR